MREGVIYSKNALYQEVMNHQDKNKRWEMNKGLPFEHCQHSLSPIGLVAKEALSPDDTAWGYAITEYGLRTGIPLAGLLLKWSYEHPEYSLYKMFGSTSSTSIKDQQALDKKRAPEARYKIFWEIATNPNNRIRLKDIADAINEDPSNIGYHLKSLGKNGFISYDVTERGKSYSYFRLKEIVPDKEPEQHGRYKILSTRTYELLTNSPQQIPREYLSVEEIVNLLIKIYPEYGDVKTKAFSDNVAVALSHFERQGYLERKRFSRDFQSQLTLSDQQRNTIVSLVTLIDNFKNGDRETVEDGRRFAQKVASDPNLFSELMLKAKEGSPFAHRVYREEMNSFLLSIVQKHPNSTTNQIMQILEEDYSKRLRPKGLSKYLSRLAGQDLIISEKTEAGNIYRVVEEENQVIPSS